MIITTARVAVLTLVLAILAPGLAAFADDTGRAAIEEVVVTARKRAEKLQDVPDSITAFTAAQIEERRLNRIADALALAPNVHMVADQDAATNIITVRGIGTNRNLASAVAYVVDGVVLPDSDAFTADLADVESIEVLKGPQGGLYGRNAIAGVINLTTKRPTNELEGEVKLGYSSGRTADVFGAISGPLITDTLLGRLTVKHHDSDGRITNQFDGDKLDHDRSTKVTGRLLWQASDALSFDFRASYLDQTTGALWFSAVNVLDTTGGEITEDMAETEPNQDDPGFTDRKILDFSLVTELTLGSGRLTSITAYDDIDVDFGEDIDITPLRVTYNTRQRRETRGISQELRYTSADDQRFRYIVGAYYQNTQRDVRTSTELDFCFFVPLPFCETPPGTVSGVLFPQNLNTTEGEFNQWAVFAQGNYDITDALELTVALRYDQDRRSQHDLLSSRNDSATFSDFQPKVSLAWKATPDLMFYATYAEGYKSGAFNPPPGEGANFPLVVKQEGTDNYELGVKSTWLGGTLLVNGAVYYTEYEHAQIFQLDLTTGGQVAINADAAEIKGGEIEIVARPVDGLELSASYGYTDAKFTDFNGTGLYDDNRLPNAPRSGLNLGARYAHYLKGELELVTRLDYHKTGTTYFAEDNLVWQPSYDTLDAQVGVQTNRWAVTVWGRNLLDQRFVTSAYSRFISPLIFGSLGIDPIQSDPGEAYGVELRWKF